MVIFSLHSLHLEAASVPLWDVYKWGPNHLAWCRFHCAQKISAGNIFRIELSGITTDFKVSEYVNQVYARKIGIASCKKAQNVRHKNTTKTIVPECIADQNVEYLKRFINWLFTV